MSEKRCARCQQTKPVSEFHKDRSTRDGLLVYCKPCQKERQREYDLRPPRIPDPPGMKRCSACKETKPVTEFYADPSQYGGHSRRCKACNSKQHSEYLKKNAEANRRRTREWRAKNPELAKDHDRKSKYGLPIGRYAAMLAEQGGGCAICGTPQPGGRGAFHVDHCHETERIRGLLCHSCNVGLGHFKHDQNLILRVVHYLSKSGGKG